MALKENLAALRERVEAGIESLTPAAGERPAHLHEALRHSLEAGGKRVRPVLLIAAAETARPLADPVPAAVAVECLHTYTLIHDDLPALDNSPLRRGRPSCHAKFGEATAILAGDALLTLAFDLLARHYASTAALGLALVADLGEAAGSAQLIGGQMEDLLNAGREHVTPETLDYIHRNKTAALLTACVTMGLRIADADQARLEHGRLLGHHLGMAFQIIDDLLDATADPGILGKPAGGDAEAGKHTYPAVHGIEGARNAAADHTAKAIAAVEAIGGENAFLRDFVSELGTRIS